MAKNNSCARPNVNWPRGNFHTVNRQNGGDVYTINNSGKTAQETA
jgi:hypothetical protein